MEIFFLNSKDIYKMTKKMLENCMFWDAWHCTSRAVLDTLLIQ